MECYFTLAKISYGGTFNKTGDIDAGNHSDTSEFEAT